MHTVKIFLELKGLKSREKGDNLIQIYLIFNRSIKMERWRILLEDGAVLACETCHVKVRTHNSKSFLLHFLSNIRNNCV